MFTILENVGCYANWRDTSNWFSFHRIPFRWQEDSLGYEVTGSPQQVGRQQSSYNLFVWNVPSCILYHLQAGMHPPVAHGLTSQIGLSHSNCLRSSFCGPSGSPKPPVSQVIAPCVPVFRHSSWAVTCRINQSIMDLSGLN